MIRAGMLSLLAVIVLASSCAERSPAMGTVCESYKSPVRNALAEYVERGLHWPRDGDPPLKPYQLSEGNRQRFIMVMKEMKATASFPAQECEQVGNGFCRVRVHCRENLLNATNVPRTYMLVLEERAGALDPVQLLSQFDGAEPDPITGTISVGLHFEYRRSKDVRLPIPGT